MLNGAARGVIFLLAAVVLLGDLTIRGTVNDSLPPRSLETQIHPGGTAEIRSRGINRFNVITYRFSNDFHRKVDDRYTDFLFNHMIDLYVQDRDTETVTVKDGGKKTLWLDAGSAGVTAGFWGFVVRDPQPPPRYVPDQPQIRENYAGNYPQKMHVGHIKHMDFVLRYIKGNAFIWVYNRRTLDSLEGIDVFLERQGDGARKLGTTDKRGMLTTAVELETDDVITAKKNGSGDMAFYKIKEYELYRDWTEEHPRQKARVHFFTDRDYFRPGETLYAAGVVKEVKNERLVRARLDNAWLYLQGPDGKMVLKKKLAPDRHGGFVNKISLPANGPKGFFYIRVFYKDAKASRRIRVGHYESNDFQLSIMDPKTRYFRKDRFSPLIVGSYMGGSPVSGGTIKGKLVFDLLPDIQSMFKEMEQNGFKLKLFAGSKYNPTQWKPGHEIEVKGTLDKDGKFRPSVDLHKSAFADGVGTLRYIVTGATPEGKEYTTSKTSYYFPGDRFTGIKIKEVVKAKTKARFGLMLVDSSGKPCEGTVDVSILKETMPPAVKVKGKRPARRLQLQETVVFKAVAVDKTAMLSFVTGEPGAYIIRCTAADESGNRVTTYRRFIVSDHIMETCQGPDLKPFQLIAPKTQWNAGDTASFTLHAPAFGKALVTVEQGRVVDAFTVDLQDTIHVTFKIKKSYFPGFFLKVNGLLMNPGNKGKLRKVKAEKYFRVDSGEKQLTVEITAPGEIKPGATGTIGLRVRGGTGNQNTNVVVYAVDEGNLGLSGYTAPDFYTRFYHGPKRWTDSSFFQTFASLDTPVTWSIFPIYDTDDFLNYMLSYTAVPPPPPPPPPPGVYRKRKRSGFNRPVYLAAPPERDAYNRFDDEDYDNAAGQASYKSKPSPKQLRARQKRALARLKEKISRIQVRSGSRELLFFKKVTTGKEGKAKITFKAPGNLTRYRVIAVAYRGDAFGTGDKQMQVAQKLGLTEAMPEFARRGDRFTAGIRVDNRQGKKIDVTVTAKPKGILIKQSLDAFFAMTPNSNRFVNFLFEAPKGGNAEVRFYAADNADNNDGLLKTLPVLNNRVTETFLTFERGKRLEKKLLKPKEVIKRTVSFHVSPTLIKPLASITKLLEKYPYGCLEQRTSKIMPFLYLDEKVERLVRQNSDLEPVDMDKVIFGYLKVLDKFIHKSGGFSYYKNGKYVSSFLSVYVLQALRLIEQRGYKKAGEYRKKIKEYLDNAKLSPEVLCYYQYELSLERKASWKVLQDLYGKRKKLPGLARVNLYKALYRQMVNRPVSSKDKKKITKTRRMIAELRVRLEKNLREEADFAFYAEPRHKYNALELPFYSSRFMTAIVLQAFLEVEGTHELAPLMVKWLLQTRREDWNTTQTNFRILAALKEYMHTMEKHKATYFTVTKPGEKTKTRHNLERKDKKITWKTGPKTTDGNGTWLIEAPEPVYLTTQWRTELSPDQQGTIRAKYNGILVKRNVYDETGKITTTFKKGKIYQVELLITPSTPVPYGVIDEPLPAGFQLIREDYKTTRRLKEFNTQNRGKYRLPWLRNENEVDRTIYYSYRLTGRIRVVYFIKALYPGEYTWMPTVVSGMYHPHIYGRTGVSKIRVLF